MGVGASLSSRNIEKFKVGDELISVGVEEAYFIGLSDLGIDLFKREFVLSGENAKFFLEKIFNAFSNSAK